MKRLAIITSHPIQYNAPLFQLLARRNKINVKVFYTWGKAAIEDKFDPGFGATIAWDIPLLNGYEFDFSINTSGKPGSHHFFGIVNPYIIESINTYNPTAILIYGWSFASHLKVLKYYKNKKLIIFRGDSTLLDEPQMPLFKKALRRLFLKWIYGKIDYALYCGSNNKNYFLKHNVKAHQLVFGPHAVDNSRYRNIENIIDFRNELSISKDKYVYLFVGKFEKKKNPILLLNAFLELNLQETNLVFVGNGELEVELKAHSKNCERIHFLDFQNQTRMPSIYRLANILVLPSQGPNETWGLVINEAMACGIPAIVSNKVGCCIDLIEEDKNGYVFESNNKVSLENSMRKAFNNKHNQEYLSTNSRDQIELYSLEKLASAIENVVIENK